MNHYICRLWHGWVTAENSDQYEHLLIQEILPGIKRIKGFKGYQLLTNHLPAINQVEFITITYFDSLQSIIEFAGQEYTKAVIPDKAKALLVRYDEESVLYELKHTDTEF